MLSILVNAYACSPNMGSEPGMAWNWCINLANHCELYIITEGEFKGKIEAVLPTLPQGKKYALLLQSGIGRDKKNVLEPGRLAFL